MDRRSIFAAFAGALASPFIIEGVAREQEKLETIHASDTEQRRIEALNLTCDLTRDHCKSRFTNELNFGGGEPISVEVLYLSGFSI